VIDKAPVQQKDEGEAMKNHVEFININTPPSNHTFKRLIRELKEARKEVARLKAKGLEDRRKMKELMYNYNNTLDLEKFASRRDLPLHKQPNNLYRLNKGFQSQNRNLKAELQHLRDELAQRNLNVLVEVVIEREEPIEKRSTPIVKKTTHTKEKHVVVIECSSPSIRRSARLMK
jgi:hypothetical protein